MQQLGAQIGLEDADALGDVGGRDAQLVATRDGPAPRRFRRIDVGADHRLEHLSLDTTIGELPFFKGKGCDACNGTGLKGRQGLYEVMFMTPKIRKLILMNVGAAEIKDGGIEDGMLTLRMDGWLKVLKGLTTLEQVIRETSV